MQTHMTSEYGLDRILPTQSHRGAQACQRPVDLCAGGREHVVCWRGQRAGPWGSELVKSIRNHMRCFRVLLCDDRTRGQPPVRLNTAARPPLPFCRHSCSSRATVTVLHLHFSIRSAASMSRWGFSPRWPFRPPHVHLLVRAAPVHTKAAQRLDGVVGA